MYNLQLPHGHHDHHTHGGHGGYCGHGGHDGCGGQGAMVLMGVMVVMLFMSTKVKTRSSWFNCALRDDEAVYWVSIGQFEAVAVGD